MAKKKGSKKGETPVAEAVQVDVPAKDGDDDDNSNNSAGREDDGAAEENEVELLQVDLGDMAKLKQVLDETVSAAILEKIPEDHRLDNFKLALMVAACGFAMVAQFAPIPFPESRPVLGACCCLYFVLSGVLQFITTFIDQDCILLTKPLEENEKNPDMEEHGLRVRSQMPRFSECYTVILEFEGRKDSPNVEHKWSVGQFFDKEGMFDEVGLMQQIDTLCSRMAEGKYDHTPGKDKTE